MNIIMYIRLREHSNKNCTCILAELTPSEYNYVFQVVEILKLGIFLCVSACTLLGLSDMDLAVSIFITCQIQL